MRIRPINLLGENFVELDPGSGDAPVLKKDVPVAQTETVVTLQALVDTFDDPTAAGLAALVSELGNGVDGHGKDLAGVLKALGPAMTGIDELGEVLEEQNADLDQLIATADPVARAVTGQEGKQTGRATSELQALMRSPSAVTCL